MKKTIFFLPLIVLVFLTAFSLYVNGYKPGDIAEDFKLKSTSGKMLSMADYKDAKGFIVIFSCNHCPYVIAYEDRMIALHNKYASLGYPVLAINSNDAIANPGDSFENMAKKADEKKFPFLYLQDETQDVAKKFGAMKTPHVYILKRSGEKQELTVAYVGAIDDNSENPAQVKEKYAENALNELLAGKPVSVKETKAIGCTVKYKK